MAVKSLFLSKMIALHFQWQYDASYAASQKQTPGRVSIPSAVSPFSPAAARPFFAEILLKPAPLSFCRSWQSVRNLFYTLVIITLSCEKSKYFLTFFCLKFFKIQRIKQRDRCCCTNTTLLACCEQQHKVWIIVTVQPVWTVMFSAL